MSSVMIFNDNSSANWAAVIFFSILLLFLPLGLMMLSARMRLKMGFKPGTKNHVTPMTLLVAVGAIGVLCMLWKSRQVTRVRATPDKQIILEGFFGNKIASFGVSGITDVLTDSHSHKTGYSSTYVITIYACGKEYNTDHLLKEEADPLLYRLDSLRGVTVPY